MDRLTEMDALVRVVDRGSFSAAARELGVSPSSVSKQIQALEARLGVRLLHRTTRRVSVTETGTAFCERARGILEDVAQAEHAVTALHQEVRGTLRVGAPVDFARAQLAGPLAELGKAHAALRIELELTDRFVDVVEEGFDVVIRIGRLSDSSLAARRLAPCRRVLCAGPRYLAQHGTPRRPSDLGAHHLIAYPNTPSWRFRDGSAISTRGRVRVNNGDVMRSLAEADLGIALLPTFVACEALRSGRLVTLLDDSLDADVAVHAVFPHRKLLSAKLRVFIDHLAASWSGTPPWDRA